MNKDMILKEYLGFTLSDLEAEQKIQEEKEFNKGLSRAVRLNAALRMEVIEFAMETFMKAAETALEKGMPLDLAAFTLGDAIEMATGKKLQDFNLISGFVGATDKAADVAVEVLRTGANKLGGWLTKFANKEAK